MKACLWQNLVSRQGSKYSRASIPEDEGAASDRFRSKNTSVTKTFRRKSNLSFEMSKETSNLCVGGFISSDNKKQVFSPEPKVIIGTSGFSYPHWGKGVFYPRSLTQAKWFEYYCQHFETVELNVSFYRLPKKKTFVGWRQRAGKDFVFAVKGSRYITHIKKLKECREPVKKFFKAASPLLGGLTSWEVRPRQVMLWQLPPRFKANVERLSDFLQFLPHFWTEPQAQHHSGSVKHRGWRHAFEFRDKSWLNREVYKLLRKYNAAVVFQENPGWPITEKITADFVYLRFHGRAHLYSSCYTENELRNWAKKIKSWQKKGLDCFAYFNNDALGYAVENAQKLRQLVRLEPRKVSC